VTPVALDRDPAAVRHRRKRRDVVLALTRRCVDAGWMDGPISIMGIGPPDIRGTAHVTATRCRGLIDTISVRPRTHG
jgi:hypothetical protein